MLNSKAENLTLVQLAFLVPKNSTHRQYEALRAFYVDKIPSHEVARRFGYTPSSFRVLCHNFSKNLDRLFFLEPKKGPRKTPKKDEIRETVLKLRKQNLSVYDIQEELKEIGKQISIPSISEILKDEGFVRLPRRQDDERPSRIKPDKAAIADAWGVTNLLQPC